MFLGLPLILGWLAFHGLLMFPIKDKNYGRFLINRLPALVVAVNLGLAGISIIAVPLTTYSIRVCSIFPMNMWTFLILWMLVIPGALPGILLLYPYELWALKSGFRAWSVLAHEEGKVSTPSWRDLWWWIVISYIVLLGGFVIGVTLTQSLTS